MEPPYSGVRRGMVRDGTRVLMGRLPVYSPDPEAVSRLAKPFRPALDWKGFKRAVRSSIRNMPIHDASALATPQ